MTDIWRGVRRLLLPGLALLASGGCATSAPLPAGAGRFSPHGPGASVMSAAAQDPAVRERLAAAAVASCALPASPAAKAAAKAPSARPEPGPVEPAWITALRRWWDQLFGGGVRVMLDVGALRPTFCETFDRPLDIAQPQRNPYGRWRTNYWFGSDGYVHAEDGKQDLWPDLASSRMIGREAQVYSDPFYAPELPSPFRVGGGALTITAFANPDPKNPKTIQPETGQVARYISGLITTETSFRQTYGYFETVVSLSSVGGSFPAFWLLGEPYSEYMGDEIDIFEHLGKHPKKLWLNSHLERVAFGTPGRLEGIDMSRPRAVGLLWTPERLTWFIDREPVFTAPNRDFHRPMYMLLNLAVGGWDGNLPEDAARFPASMRIYSVRAWALPAKGGPPIFKVRG